MLKYDGIDGLECLLDFNTMPKEAKALPYTIIASNIGMQSHEFYILKDFANVKKLDLSNNNLTGYISLEKFPNLEEIDARGNQIDELDFSKNPHLRRIKYDYGTTVFGAARDIAIERSYVDINIEREKLFDSIFYHKKKYISGESKRIQIENLSNITEPAIQDFIKTIRKDVCNPIIQCKKNQTSKTLIQKNKTHIRSTTQYY